MRDDQGGNFDQNFAANGQEISASSGGRKNRQTKQPMQTTQTDFQLKKVRQAKEQIDQQTKDYQETLKKVKNEVSQYKQAYLEQ